MKKKPRSFVQRHFEALQLARLTTIAISDAMFKNSPDVAIASDAGASVDAGR